MLTAIIVPTVLGSQSPIDITGARRLERQQSSPGVMSTDLGSWGRIVDPLYQSALVSRLDAQQMLYAMASVPMTRKLAGTDVDADTETPSME